jgi:hypothetical protein
MHRSIGEKSKKSPFLRFKKSRLFDFDGTTLWFSLFVLFPLALFPIRIELARELESELVLDATVIETPSIDLVNVVSLSKRQRKR